MSDISRLSMSLNLPPLHDRLRHVFTTGFTAIDIAESLLVFDVDKPASVALDMMQDKKVSVAGLADQGRVVGYITSETLKSGCCKDHMLRPASKHILNFNASYQDVVKVLSRAEYCFVTFLNRISAVIQKKDMAKPSVRMWLFGLITISEMILTKALEHFYPNDSWQIELPERRLQKAQSLLVERQRRGQDLELMDCLYLVDKATILTKNPIIRKEIGFENRNEAKEAIYELESLRNSLAHTNDIITYDWNAIVAMAERLDLMLSRFKSDPPLEDAAN